MRTITEYNVDNDRVTESNSAELHLTTDDEWERSCAELMARARAEREASRAKATKKAKRA